MKRHLLWLAAAILLASPMLLTSCSTTDNPATEPFIVSNPIGKALSEMPNVHDIVKLEDTENYGFKEAYDVFFEQPVDHKNPAAGTFMQRVRVCIRDVNAPTVIWTSGYGFAYNMPIGSAATTTDLAMALGANYIEAEHRYYGDSQILTDPRWDYLTFEQAAADHHVVIQTLKTLLPKEWISTGVSKNGETSLLQNYYYPDDVDVTTAFCAPILTSLLDIRPGRYSQLECATGTAKEIIDSHLNRLFVNGKDGLYSRYCQRAKEKKAATGRTFDLNSFEQYVYKILDSHYATFENYITTRYTSILPPIDCTDDDLLNYYFAGHVKLSSQQASTRAVPYWIEADMVNYPFAIQKAKQMGERCYDYSLYPQLEGTGFDADKLNSNPKENNPLDLFDCDLWLYDTYDNSVFIDMLQNHLPNCTKPILLVYAKTDPWTGARVTDVNPVAKLMINPVGMHNQDINNEENYTPEMRQEIIDYIAKYVKLPEGVIRGDAEYRRTVKR